MIKILQNLQGLRGFLAALLVAVVVWGICCLMGVGQQRSLFHANYERELSDFWMPQMCLQQGYTTAVSSDYGIDEKIGGRFFPEEPAGHEIERSDWYATKNGTTLFVTGRMDKVYPAFALLPFKLFPASRIGGYCWTILAGCVFLLSLVFCAHGRWWPLLFVGSMPFLFNFERGNPVWLSAAAVGVFLAWWDSEQRGRRIVAAICLGVAACLKIAPAVLGVLYLARIVHTRARGQSPFAKPLLPIWGDSALAGLTALVLFFAFWPLAREGFSAIPLMIQNAASHAQDVVRAADFGLVTCVRKIRVVLGLDIHQAWTGMQALGVSTRLLGAVALLWGAWKRDYLLLVGGFMLLAGNMYYYAALYLLPVFVLQPPRKLLEWLGWFVIVCPLQLVVTGHSTNTALCNLALMGLMLLRVAAGFGLKNMCYNKHQ